ncbi:hypothetical protein B0H16DRAFT_1684424 [Mycena metata]|uniref:Uncharacterized protein n=1 Tax=Mycena metata TaxID=1033252 RepID=A0AAD7NUI9_9AGAR|nr:hypothetical protein B0H16DRAFT_1684424 [Mycena metata]
MSASAQKDRLRVIDIHKVPPHLSKEEVERKENKKLELLFQTKLWNDSVEDIAPLEPHTVLVAESEHSNQWKQNLIDNYLSKIGSDPVFVICAGSMKSQAEEMEQSTSIFPLANALTVAAGYKSVVTDNLSSLATTSKFLIASKQFGTELNIGYSVTGDGSAVILYTAETGEAPNQQWILNNVIGSPTQYTIESAIAPTFLSFPGAGASTTSWNGQTIVDATCYPTYTIQQVTPGENAYSITENTFGGILTAWAQYTEGVSIGMATFQRSADLGAAQVWMLYAAPP